ncbi:hypothetical protein C8R47DRAFT_1082755 [Mycena vitilis]|nr:hypothetical protein C8R47DRAFT_1082755 [Mycena vitilis]
MTDLNNLAPAAAAPALPAGASTTGASDTTGVLTPSPTSGNRDQLRSALEQLSSAVDAIAATSAAVGTTTVSQGKLIPAALYMVLADLAVATTAVSDAAAGVEASAAVFLAAAASPVVPAAPATRFRTTGPWIAGSLYAVIPAEHLSAVPDNNEKWFAITSGKYVGLTKNAALSLNAVVGVSNALSTSFSSQADALDHFNSALDGDAITIFRKHGGANTRAFFPDLNCIVGNERISRIDQIGQLRSASPDPSPSGRETLYRVDTLTQVQYTNHWQVSDEAAHLSQGVSDARATRVARKPKGRCARKSYVVFFGRVPGVYKTWAEARIQVDGARGNIHQSYPSEDTAHAAFQYAQERGWVRVCTSRPPSPSLVPIPIPSLPEPVGLLDTPNPLHTGSNGPASPGGRWYVVYTGVSPGVYQSSLECTLNICGIPSAVHDSWECRDLAIAKYQHALGARRVAVLSPPYARFS